MAVIPGLFDEVKTTSKVVPNLFPETTVKSKVVPGLFDEQPKSKVVLGLFDSIPAKKEGALSTIAQEGLIKPIKSFASGFYKASANFADTLDFYSDKISMAMGNPKAKGSVFELLRDNWDRFSKDLEQGGLSESVVKKIYTGLGEAGFEVPKLMAMGPQGLAVSGAAEGGKAGGVGGAIVGAATGGLTKGALTGLNTLPSAIKYPSAFGFGAVTTPGGVEEKVAGGAVMTGLSVGKSPSMRDFKENQKFSPINKILPYEARERYYQNIVNRFQSIENITERAKAMGMDIKPGENPAIRAREYLSNTAKTDQVLKNGTYRITPEGKIEMTGEGLQSILNDYDKTSPIKGVNDRAKDLNQYLIARRTIEDLQRPKSEFTGENIVSPEQVKKAQETMDRLSKKYGVERITSSVKPPDPQGGTIAPKLKPLAAEARKYKTAEEFVKNANTVNPSEKGVFQKYTPELRSKMPIGENIQTLDKSIGGKPDDIITIYRGTSGNKINAGDYITTNKQLAKDYAGTGNVVKLKVRKGDIIDTIDEAGMEEYIYKPNADKLKPQTKSQLTDIWNKAQGAGQKPPVEPPKTAVNIPIFDKTAARLYDYQKRVLHNLVDSGNMSEAQYQDILAKNPNYIPFDRVMPEGTPSGGTPVSKNRFTGARSPVKRIKGSELEIQDPIESIIKNTYRIMDIAERNSIARNVARLGEVLPGEISPVKVSMQPVKLTEKESATGQPETIFRPSQFKPKGNVIEYFDQGKRKYIEVTPNLYQAMTGLNEVSSNLFSKLLSIPAGTLRVGATITPEFMLRNPIRDQWTAMLQTRVGFKMFKDSSGAVADILGKSEVYNDWIRSGGAHAGFVELSRPNLQKMVKNLRSKEGFFTKGGFPIISQAQDISQLFEQATRLGVYKAALDKGMSPVEAAFQSRESTLDFARRGAKTKDINSAIAFFNAGIQSVDKTARVFRDDPAGATAKAIASITIPSLLLYLKNRQDPDYKEIPRWRKDLFWVTKFGNTYIQIPKPFSYGQVFGSLPERFFEYLDSSDPKALNGLTKSLYDSISPVSGDPTSGLLPTAIKPLIENATNWNFFTQRNIVPQGKEGLLPEAQFTKYTSDTGKMVGKWLNYSPAKFENLIQSYFGGTGRYALQGGDLVLKAVGQETTSRRPAELADIPLIKGFVTRSVYTSPESLQSFYRQKEQLSRPYLTYKNYLNTGETEKAKEILTRFPKAKYYPVLNKYSEILLKFNNAIDNVVKQNASALEKKEKINSLEKRRLNLLKSINRYINTVEKNND